MTARRKKRTLDQGGFTWQVDWDIPTPAATIEELMKDHDLREYVDEGNSVFIFKIVGKAFSKEPITPPIEFVAIEEK